MNNTMRRSKKKKIPANSGGIHPDWILHYAYKTQRIMRFVLDLFEAEERNDNGVVYGVIVGFSQFHILIDEVSQHDFTRKLGLSVLNKGQIIQMDASPPVFTSDIKRRGNENSSRT